MSRNALSARSLRAAALLLSVALGVLALAAPARADAALDARRAELEACVAQSGDAARRARAVQAVAELGTPEAARVLLTCLDQLSVHRADLEERQVRTQKDYEPYEGYTFTDPKAWDIKKRLRKQLDDQAEEIQADGVVLAAFAAGIAKFTDADALTSLERGVGTPKDFARRALFEGLLRNEKTDAVDLGRKALKDGDAGVRLVALEALAGRKVAGTLEFGVKGLKERGWPHRQAAARLLQALGDLRAVAPLVDAMAGEEGRLIEVYAEALRAITKAEIGPFPDVWRQWYDDNKARLGELGVKGATPRKAREGAGQGIDYYGIETRSRRIVFLIDVSGSMKDPIGSTNQDVTGQAEDTYNGRKVDIAKRVLKQAIRNLPEEARFDFVIFNHAVRIFEPNLVPATQDNKNKAYLMINDLEASGATFTYGALEKAFHLAGRGVTDKAYDPGVDTIFVLSDGAPTTDDVDNAQPMDAQKILSAVREWNALSRISIHTIAIDPGIGGGQAFVRFMKSLAAQNGGTYAEIGGDGRRSGDGGGLLKGGSGARGGGDGGDDAGDDSGE